jgi:hypothetical protein
VETPLSQQVKFLNSTNSERFKSLNGLWASDLPEEDFGSTYALELANIVAFWIDLSPIVQGFSKFRRNETWASIQQPLYLGIAIAFLTAQMEKTSIFTEANGAYLRAKLNSRLDSLGSLVNSPSEPVLETTAAASRASSAIDTAVYSARLKFSSSNPLERMMKLVPIMSGAFAATKTLLERNGVTGDYLAPLRGIPNTTKLITPTESIPPKFEPPKSEPKPHPVSGLSNAGSAESQYEQWVQYCKDVATLQRMPERLITDLIPPKEIADHSLKTLAEWEDALEETFPGRRQWLLDEGVTRKDFDTFWGFPSWVQNFIEKLMTRNQQLEFKSVVDLGKSEEQAALHTAMFIPYFDVQPRDAGPETRPLPFELFERVRKYYASLDDSWQAEFVSNKCVTLNHYLRMCIKEKRL